jgi:hypothetical protein
MKSALQNCATEWSYVSGTRYRNPFQDVELEVVFTEPNGCEKRVPAFWGGEQVWRVRYASSAVGRHRFRTVCSDKSNPDLHGREGELEVRPYEGGNDLLRHGPLRVAANRRYLEHVDGAPFFWLGDTWWYGLVGEFAWPGEFQELVADRRRKGFNLIQLVAGYVPAMPEGTLRGGNEAGLPWGLDYRTINPGYFDLADLRIDCLVQNGFVPCIFGSWGDWLLKLGIEKMKQHWRYLIARYGAYPVVWSLCGEVGCLYPITSTADEAENERSRTFLRAGWSDIARYIGRMDPYRHPLTAHPNGGTESRENLEEDVPLTVAMLQTGHSFRNLQGRIPGMLDQLSRAVRRQPRLPVVNGEPNYEGIFGSSWQDVQRFQVWSCLLGGAAGYTYGAAEGCWHVHHRGREPFPLNTGPWGSFEDWRDIAAFPGSGQMQYARRLLERYDWQRFEPHPEWLEIRGAEHDGCFIPYAAGIPSKVRVIYTSPPSYVCFGSAALAAVTALEPDAAYRAFFYDPRSGKQQTIGPVEAVAGRWPVPQLPSYQDWVLVLETETAARQAGAGCGPTP